MSLRRQFVLVFVSFAVVLTAAGGWLAWSATRRALERELEDKLVWVAGAAAAVGLPSSALEPLQRGDEGTPIWTQHYQRLKHLQRYVASAYVFRRDHTLLVSTAEPDSLPIGSRLHWLDVYSVELDRAWDVGHATTPLFRGEDGRHYKYGFVRLEQSDVMLAVLMSADFLQPLQRFRRTILLGSVVAVALAALLAGVLATNVVRPVERLSRVALRIQRGRLDRPVLVEGASELGRLSRAMERMRHGILQRDEQLRLMLAQVAHEIRNPLGGLELFASAAADTDDPDERRRLIGRVREEIGALNQIIHDFLTFARPRSPDSELHDVRVPVREAVELLEAEVSGDGDGTQVRLDLPEQELMARADPYQVKRLVLNLLRNAAHAGETIWVRGEWRNGEAVVSVRDDGPGVPRELKDRIFEPFVSDKERGAGLGLAIVKGIAEANAGRVELVDGDAALGEGAEFRVYFPGSDELPPAERPSSK